MACTNRLDCQKEEILRSFFFGDGSDGRADDVQGYDPAARATIAIFSGDNAVDALFRTGPAPQQQDPPAPPTSFQNGLTPPRQ